MSKYSLLRFWAVYVLKLSLFLAFLFEGVRFFIKASKSGLLKLNELFDLFSTLTFSWVCSSVENPSISIRSVTTLMTFSVLVYNLSSNNRCSD